MKRYKRKSKKKAARKTKEPWESALTSEKKRFMRATTFSHFEMDTVLLTKAKGACLLTLTEQQSRLELIRLIPDKTTKSVNQALEEILQQQQIESITSDKGLKFARLNEVFSKPIDYHSAMPTPASSAVQTRITIA